MIREALAMFMLVGINRWYGRNRGTMDGKCDYYDSKQMFFSEFI